MKFIATIVFLFLFTGCASSPKKPPTCKGKFEPINPQMMSDKQLKSIQEHNKKRRYSND